MARSFKSLSKKGQKMRIVKDAIAQIKAKIVIPNEGIYFNIPEFVDNDFLPVKRGTDLQQLLQSGRQCEACAKGSLFAACVLNVDEVRVGEKMRKEKFQKEKLEKWFSALELDMVEVAFEGVIIWDSTGKLFDSKEEKECIRFHARYDDYPKKRLLKILENILKYGEFKP